MISSSQNAFISSHGVVLFAVLCCSWCRCDSEAFHLLPPHLSHIRSSDTTTIPNEKSPALCRNNNPPAAVPPPLWLTSPKGHQDVQSTNSKGNRVVAFWGRIKNRMLDFLLPSRSRSSVDTITAGPTLEPSSLAAATNFQPKSAAAAAAAEGPNDILRVATRWAFPNNSTNLSGTWKPVITQRFKQAYDEYLRNCSQPFVFRRVVMNVLGVTRDKIEQDGRELTITGTNPAGTWRRTLISSGADKFNAIFEPIFTRVVDPDDDLVEVEAWWEDNGTRHRSILRGKPRVNGGEFETIRYLAGENLICESYFHPDPSSAKSKFRPGFVKWTYQRA